MKTPRKTIHPNKRRGAAVALTAISSTLLIGFVALTVDVGMLYNVRAELQRTADAAALAGAWELFDHAKLKGTSAPSEMSTSIAECRTQASVTAYRNPVQKVGPLVDLNSSNALNGDIVVGYLHNPNDLTEQLSFANPSDFNTVQVRVRKDNVRNGPVQLWFARIFGINTTNMEATAAATFKDGVTGFKVTEETGNCQLLPFALQVDVWKALLAGTKTTGDGFSYNTTSKTVTSGADGINELNLYPGGGTGSAKLEPGNFGTVDIGPSNNSTADIARQIRYGVSAEDLAALGGQLKLTNGSLQLNGDTGLSAGVKDDLAAIIGQPRIIPLFSQTSGNGNNAYYTIVGFAGIRILDVKLTGSMKSKQVIIQPCVVCDSTAITEEGSGPSYFVYQPVHLTR